MDSSDAAKCMESLGNTTRLEIFRTLIRAGQGGTQVGAIQERLGIPASTLSHHIRNLMDAQLVSQNREGRKLVCCANYTNMNALVGFLTAECCVDEGTDSGCC